MNRRQLLKNLTALPFIGGLAGKLCYGQVPVYSLRFADGCIFHDNILRSEFHIDMNWLEIDQFCEKKDNTGHYAWESCKLANEHCVRGPGTYSIGKFSEVFLYKNEKRFSDDSWHIHKITWFGGKEVRVNYLYGSTPYVTSIIRKNSV